MSFEWARDHPDLQLICRAYGMYELLSPIRFHYKPLSGYIQDGPQCGLVALAVCANNATKEYVNEIFTTAKAKGYTNNGEMFSADYMCDLAKGVLLKHRCEVHEGTLDTEKIVEFLLKGGMVLVPYDCDRNHTPCLMNGHKAHWAIVSGVIETDTSVYVIAKHGKSLNTAVWDLNDLARSNEQLTEFSPDRKQSDLTYVLPDGGIAGDKGLCGRSVLIHPAL